MDRDNNHTRRRYLAGISSTVALGGLAGCSGDSSGTTSTETTADETTTGEMDETTETTTAEETSVEELMDMADPPEEIVFVNAPTTPHTHYALEAGIFEDHGLNVTLTEQPVFDFSQNLTMAATGQADVSVGASPTQLFGLAREQDIYMDLVFPMVTIDFAEDYYGYTMTVVNDDANIETFSDLAGSEFAHFGSATDDLASMRWLAEQHGIDPSGVCFGCQGDQGLNLTARVPLDQIVSSVARGEVTAGNSIEPRILSAIDGGASVKRLTSEDGLPFNKNRYVEADAGGTVATWVVGPEFKEDYPHTLKLMQRALAETLTHIYDPEYQDDYIATGAEVLRVSESVYRKQIEERFSTKPVESVSAARPWESMEKAQNVLMEYGDIEEEVDVMDFILPWDKPQ